MQKADEIPGYTKLVIEGREAYLKTEFDQTEICVSSLYDVLNPNSPLKMTITRWNGSTQIVSLSADITVRVEETNHQFDVSLTRSLSSSSEWAIRLDSYIDLYPLHIVYIYVIVIMNKSALAVQMKNLFSSKPRSSTPFFFNSSMNSATESVFPVLTCSVDVISRENHKVYMESKELLCLHSTFFAALFYRDFKQGEMDHCEIHSIMGETFEICTVFGSLLNAMHGNYDTPMVCTLILADRFCMDRVKSRVERSMVCCNLSYLIFFNLAEWIRAADMARCHQLVDTLVQRAIRSVDLLQCYETLHESLGPETRLKIVRRMHALAGAESK
ncbi:hypothetical protein PENTCL1PPCAC_23281, partial [Pristionchus entomophagus]